MALSFQYDNSLERFMVHPHVLRKFFRTKMGQVIPVDVTEALMGREGYLTEVYRRYSLEDLAKFYKQGEHTLLVFAESENLSKLKEEQKQLQALVNGLTAENMELKAKVNALERQIAELNEKWQRLDQNTKELIESKEHILKMLKEKSPQYIES
jgi:predicted RNase H-like nuclease (RuvC/YqgF family)